jgi:hypothetical protein
VTRPGLGYLADPPDDRDVLLGSRLGALAASPPPASASVEHPAVGPRDQTITNSCVGQGISQGYRLAALHLGIVCPELSALFPYLMSRAEHQDQTRDEGTYVRTAIQAVRHSGIPDETAWPFDEGKVNTVPNMRARRSAYDRRGIRHYSRIVPGDVDGVRRAIAAGFPVVAGWMVDEAFLHWNGDGVVTGQLRPIGGHCMVITSYAADGTFRLLNSWGRSWGREGWGVVDDMFVSSLQDGWVLEIQP